MSLHGTCESDTRTLHSCLSSATLWGSAHRGNSGGLVSAYSPPAASQQTRPGAPAPNGADTSAATETTKPQLRVNLEAFGEITKAFYGNEEPARSFCCLSPSTNTGRGYGGPTGSLENVVIGIFHIPSAVLHFYPFSGCKWMDFSFVKWPFCFPKLCCAK